MRQPETWFYREIQLVQMYTVLYQYTYGSYHRYVLKFIAQAIKI